MFSSYSLHLSHSLFHANPAVGKFLISTLQKTNCSDRNPLNYNHPHIAALILARGGSKGIPLKNLAKLNGRSLLSITLSVVLQVNFSSVWVSTDHFKILQEAGVVNVHWRSEESARDDASSILGVLDFIHKHPEVDAVALVQCTSPFIKAEYLKQALEEISKGKECVFSVTRSHKLRWIQRQDGSVLPLNFAIHNRPRRQDWPGELLENGMFYFAERKLINRGLLQSHRYSTTNLTNESLPVRFIFMKTPSGS
ncbi:N-acylneuraminate cytidylyltransferase-like Protein [Tribolium castaneum]|uniref:N-acylneuraminate cytidylyltransferase-like Protein n=1 Tax=Tribolium castaneum TaxID=7070 RepID=D6WYC9_TRICA|nr:N-acylneuraminate cytidylyltransferase-like Protein [Tribolium castaneum]